MLTATHVMPFKPLPPLPPLSAPPRRERTDATIPALFGFRYQRRYGGLYTNKHERFVLREEHVSELKRLVNDHRREWAGRANGISMSDIVNAALDFALEHPVAFMSNPAGDLRDSLAREVYRKAFVHFMRHELV